VSERKRKKKDIKNPRKPLENQRKTGKKKNSFHVKKTLCGAISKAGLTIKHPGF